MSDLLKKLPAGEIVAENVSLEDFLANYTGTETHYEWVEGFVIQMPPNHENHDFLVNYFQYLLEDYLSQTQLGKFRREFRVNFPHSSREPDLFVTLNTNRNLLTKTMMQGAPDICIEMVSKESIERDYQDKREEYQRWGVQEYWIIDYLTQKATFYRLQENGIYKEIFPDNAENYRTPLLPKLKIHIPTLWQDELPSIRAISKMIDAMLAEEE